MLCFNHKVFTLNKSFSIEKYMCICNKFYWIMCQMNFADLPTTCKVQHAIPNFSKLINQIIQYVQKAVNYMEKST